MNHFKNGVDKQKYISNVIEIMRLELENYNLTASYGEELCMEDVITHWKQTNKK